MHNFRNLIILVLFSILLPQAAWTQQEASVEDYFMNGFTDLEKGRIELVKSAEVDDQKLYKLELKIEDGAAKVRVQYSNAVEKNPALILPVASMIKSIRSNLHPIQPRATARFFRIFETLTNMEAGSLSAAADFNQLERVFAKKALSEAEFSSSAKTEETLKNFIAQKAEQIETLNKASEVLQKKQQRKLLDWRESTQALDTYEKQFDKLNDYILQNDRKKVAELLRAYLPWALMEPVEASAWKIWVEAIENPNTDKTTVALRGIDYDTDKIQRQLTKQGERIGFMSTVLTKNQGNYTRRLRSLTTNREKNGDLKEFAYPRTSHIKISQMMESHANTPSASNFLSFTTDPEVFKQFVGKSNDVAKPRGGMLAVKIDSRRFFPNLSNDLHESEILAPLIIFPDEVVVYREGSTTTISEISSFLEEVTQKTGAKFEYVNEQHLLKPGFEFFNDLRTKTLSQSSTRSCAKVF